MKHLALAPAASAPFARKTSRDVPQHVDFVPLARYGVSGRLGITSAPGKRDRKWDRDLDADLQVLVNHGADVIVSLLEDEEYTGLGIAAYPERAAAEGIRFVRTGIRDLHEPHHEAPFRAVVAQIIDELKAGRTVFVHCRSGVGRAVLTATCVLIALGLSAAEAFLTVRTYRTCADTTHRQEAYMVAFEHTTNPSLRARANAALQAGAYGKTAAAVYALLHRGGTWTCEELRDCLQGADSEAVRRAVATLHRYGLITREGYRTCTVGPDIGSRPNGSAASCRTECSYRSRSPSGRRAEGASDAQIEERFGIVSGLGPAFLPVEFREPDPPNFPMPTAPRDWRDDPAAIPLQAPVRVREWLADPLWRVALVKTDSGVSYRVGGLDAGVDPAGNTLYARAARENLPMPTLVGAYHQWLQRAHPTTPLPADRLADLNRYFLVLGVFTNETPTSLCLTDLIVDGTVQPHAELRALATLVDQK
jgi:ADP-ribosyl-[dinitrogen reductase] hydrolase